MSEPRSAVSSPEGHSTANERTSHLEAGFGARLIVQLSVTMRAMGMDVVWGKSVSGVSCTG